MLSDISDAPGTAATALLPVRRRLVVTWQHPITRSISPVALLEFDGHAYTFHYIRNALVVADFRPFLGFAALDRRYVSDRLFPLFAQRAMTPRRPDFTRWVTQLGLDEDATPWEQIARSGGRRHGDTIQLFPVPVVANGRIDCDFLVHGMRHIARGPIQVGDRSIHVSPAQLEERLSTLQPGDELALCNEPLNPKNPRAILTTTTDEIPLGWAPDLLVDEIHRIQAGSPAVVTARSVNGPEAGWHLRLLVHLSAAVPNHFEVFTAPSWETLAR